jgi:hypothetical protein
MAKLLHLLLEVIELAMFSRATGGREHDASIASSPFPAFTTTGK